MACTLHTLAGVPAPDLSGFTLIIPCLSVGNIDQLTLDMLLNTALSTGRCIRIGSLSCPVLREVVGVGAFDSCPGPSFALELFVCSAARIAILQQRSAAVDGMHEAFAASMLAWLCNQGIARVIAMTCADAALKPDAVRRSAMPLLYIPTSSVTAGDEDAIMTACGALRWPLTAAPAADESLPLTQDATGLMQPSAGIMGATAHAFDGLWGTGYAPVYHRRVLTQAAAAGEAPLPSWTTLVMFASEGENMADAARLAAVISSAINVLPSEMPLVPPAYFSKLAGPPVDLSTGLFGF